MKTATDRAAEALEAAETLFADEMGATLDLSPAARMVLIAKIAAAIQAAVAEGSEKTELAGHQGQAPDGSISIPRTQTAGAEVS